MPTSRRVTVTKSRLILGDEMDAPIAFFAALAASIFSIDLWLNYARKPRPHIVGDGVGITMFALATLALFAAVVWGWNPA